jgi:hypothetical protein
LVNPFIKQGCHLKINRYFLELCSKIRRLNPLKPSIHPASSTSIYITLTRC